MTTEGNDQSSEEPGFTFNDKRRVDPDTGELRPETDAQSASAEAGAPGAGAPDAPGAGAPDAPGAGEQNAGAADEDLADASDLGVDIPADASTLNDTEAAQDGAEPEPEPGSEAAAHLADLKRVNAEYAAYRMRADRERERAATGGVIKTVEALIPVLDEVKLAQENGDVSGPFETHVKKLVDSLTKVGIEQYGEVGDEFDPHLHEALMQQPSDEVETPTVFVVMQPGYRLGDRIIRAARVGVQQPED
ncbi:MULTISPECIES: nucleotide exchange factor GrpE [unclassified Brevibacterium]|uniref:nucleotide exchange factor GrpE n=1 Tax=unclassified Brevibacterium TaxID=2614124 RepID=UPI001E49DCE8|nr:MULTISPECIES: nucleotide exchange factor GrpE [unclassified Brevibacterium]MCD1286564.1 nucleotide exchange factor GrpE [Brevibacterium sp. CCUG 69071]MDK8434205.1 nucleotide exchange factor GrpE [Brevibacterium sp. H-BE7]